MKKLAISFLALVLTITAGQAFAEMVDDFSGDLSAYTKSVVLTTSGDDEAMSLTRTAYAIDDGKLDFSSSVTNGKAYQTVLLRDDYSLDVGERLQVELSDCEFDNGDSREFGLCVAGKKDGYGWPATRENFLTVGLYRAAGATRIKSVMFNGTTEAYLMSTLSGYADGDVIGFYIDRTADETYDVGYTTSAGDVPYLTRAYTGGAAAIGFYSDVRQTIDPLLSVDNLEIVPEPSTLALILGGLVLLVMRRRFSS